MGDCRLGVYGTTYCSVAVLAAVGHLTATRPTVHPHGTVRAGYTAGSKLTLGTPLHSSIAKNKIKMFQHALLRV